MFVKPNASYFRYKIVLRKLDTRTDGKTNSPNVVSADVSHETRCHFEYSSMR